MVGVEVPAPVVIPHPLERGEGWANARIVPVSQGRKDIEAHEEVVVVVDRIV
jgi:hypothetical protein